MSVFVVLVLLWAAVLVPPVLRARAERRAAFIESFSRQMDTLGRKAGAGRGTSEVTVTRARPTLPLRPANPTKRRRDVLGGLLGAMIGSLLLGLIPSLRSVWILFLFLVNLFIAYIALLAHRRRHRRRAHALGLRRRALSPAFDTTR